jgi:hypothetical protein
MSKNYYPRGCGGSGKWQWQVAVEKKNSPKIQKKNDNSSRIRTQKKQKPPEKPPKFSQNPQFFFHTQLKNRIFSSKTASKHLKNTSKTPQNRI